MLRLGTRLEKNCQGINRRALLEIGTLTGLGVSLPNLLATRRRAAADSNANRDVSCILIWTQGGTSHHDTFDPKPLAPASVRGEFNAIDTAIPGVQFTEVVPRMAREAKRFALLRGWNPANGSHGVADQYMMSGHQFNPALAYPCYGSIVAHEHGFKTAMPPFIQLGEALDRRFGGGSAGYLGPEFNPFELLADPNASPFVVRDISLPRGVDPSRMSRRQKMLARVDALQKKAEQQPASFQALDEHYKAAITMITSSDTKRAFDLDSEDERTRERYGKNRFGQGCLLARRLIESGVRFVTLTSGGWDTHQNNFSALKNLMPPVDQALPELLIDLAQRGLLDTTLVVWLTDFGRTPKVNSANGRDHWASAGFAIMAGAGITDGTVLGTTDEEGGRPTRDEVSTEDIAATIYSKLSIPLDLITYSRDGRPVKLNDGRPIRALS